MSSGKCVRCKRLVDERFPLQGYLYCQKCLDKTTTNLEKTIRSKSKEVIKELSKGSADDKIGRLNSLVGTGDLPGNRLKRELMSKAPGEMDKAIKKFQKQGKAITVDSLCSEIKSTPSFLRMCSNVGLEISWFENLAKQRMEARNL